MTCKRCGCTETTPCLRDGRPCAWMLPDLCTACLTPEEAAIDKAYAGIIAGLRTEQLFQRCLLAIAPGLATDPSLRADTRAFVERAFELASALAEAADVDADDGGQLMWPQPDREERDDTGTATAGALDDRAGGTLCGDEQ